MNTPMHLDDMMTLNNTFSVASNKVRTAYQKASHQEDYSASLADIENALLACEGAKAKLEAIRERLQKRIK